MTMAMVGSTYPVSTVRSVNVNPTNTGSNPPPNVQNTPITNNNEIPVLPEKIKVDAITPVKDWVNSSADLLTSIGVGTLGIVVLLIGLVLILKDTPVGDVAVKLASRGVVNKISK